MIKPYITYFDYIHKLYHLDYVPRDDKPFYAVRTITFQVTDDCCCQCTYCYQKNKGHRVMDFDTGKKIVDLLFDMYDKDDGTFINKDTKGLIFDFIGGEPLMNINVIDEICTYFLNKCIELDHPWQYCWRVSMISNGKYYFEPPVQRFLNKFKGFVDFGITLDGPKDLHDSCRIYPDGSGNFDDAYKAWLDVISQVGADQNMMKVTIAPENLKYLNEIVDFFVSQGATHINANTVFEANWTVEEGKEFYKQLKLLANKLLALPEPIYVSLFEEKMFMKKIHNQTWCGGGAQMIAFDPEGIAYPCIRYMKSSLSDDAPEIVLGDCNGLYVTDEQKKIYDDLRSVDWVTQNTEECLSCPISEGCAECMAWSYQEHGEINKRSTRICNMHKARSLANVYYWNKYYKKIGEDKIFELNLSKDECLKFIDEEEYQMLLKLTEDER